MVVLPMVGRTPRVGCTHRKLSQGPRARSLACVGHPKTSKSRRTLPIFGLRDDLLTHFQWQAEHGLDDSGHVFTTQDGRPLAPWTFGKRELQRVLTAAGY